MIRISEKVKQIEEEINDLPFKQREHLVKKLQEDLLKKQFTQLLKEVKNNVKKTSISPKDVTQEIEIVRRRLYGKSCR